MYKSKSVLLLKSFSKEEVRQFSNFLKSPYFNTNMRISRLFDELKKFYPEFTANGAAKESIYKKMYPGKPYNEQVMKNFISELFRLEKEFLSFDAFKNDIYNNSMELINQLTIRHINPVFRKEAEAFEEILKQGDRHSNKLHYYLFHLEENRFTNNLFNNRQESVTGNISKSGEYLAVFFLNNILRLSINNSVNKFSFNTDTEVNFPDRLLKSIDMENLLKFMEEKKIEQTTNLKLMYYAMVCNQKVDDDKAYNIYKEMLYENLSKLNRDEAHPFLHFLESACAQKINAGRTEFYNDLFETYEIELIAKLHKPLANTPLTVMKFRNIYLSAMRVGKYEWAEKFINDYKEELHEENRQDIVELALAQLNFEKKLYDGTLKCLNKINSTQLFFKVDVNNLRLMSFYELGHYESGLSLIDSFKRMLSNNKSLTEQYRQKNINFINSVGNLIRARSDSDGSVARLKEKVNGLEEMANKKWLLQKMEEMV